MSAFEADRFNHSRTSPLRENSWAADHFIRSGQSGAPYRGVGTRSVWLRRRVIRMVILGAWIWCFSHPGAAHNARLTTDDSRGTTGAIDAAALPLGPPSWRGVPE